MRSPRSSGKHFIATRGFVDREVLPAINEYWEGCAHSSSSASPPTSTPVQVWRVDDLPKGPTGKILKREIAPPAAAAER